MGRIDFDDIQGERSYSGARAYNQSKLANVLFTYELAERLRGASVTTNALHPGVVSTSFGAEDPGGVQRHFVPLLRPFMKSPAQGAATSIHLAGAPHLAHATGRYFVNGNPTRSSKRSYDTSAAARLWRVSADLVGVSVAAPCQDSTKGLDVNARCLDSYEVPVAQHRGPCYGSGSRSFVAWNLPRALRAFALQLTPSSAHTTAVARGPGREHRHDVGRIC